MRDEKVKGSWPSSPARAGEPFDARELRSRQPSVKLRGRNLTKADILVYRLERGDVAVKDYSRRPWPVRHTLGRWLVGREIAAYRALDGARGVPRFLGRAGPFAFAMEWIDAHPLQEMAPETMSGEVVDRVGHVVDEIHRRGVVVADLNHRDCLVDREGGAWVVDFATSVVAGTRPGFVRRWLFERLRQADLVGLARLRARFEGRDEGQASRTVGREATAWYRRGRALKRVWNNLRGRED